MIQEILISRQNHLNFHGETNDIPVQSTKAAIEDDIKSQKENVSEQENKRTKVKTKLDELHNTAKQFIEEVDNFEGTRDSSKYYYIEESLRRLVDTLDNMFEDIGNDEYLRVERKKVFNCVFPLFDKLDEKVGGAD